MEAVEQSAIRPEGAWIDDLLERLESGDCTGIDTKLLEDASRKSTFYQRFRFVRALTENGLYSLATQITSLKDPDLSKGQIAIVRSQQALATIFKDGELRRSLDTLEELFLSRETLGDDFASAVIGDYFGRAIALAVSFRMAPESALLRSKHLLGDASQRYAAVEETDLALRARISLSQVECFGTYPNPVAALALLNSTLTSIPQGEKGKIVVDVMRRQAEISCVSSPKPKSEKEIRKEFSSVVKSKSLDASANRVLTELSIARVLRHAGFDPALHLENALKTAHRLSYLTGVYEALSALATLDLEKGHYVRALKRFEELSNVALSMGFSQGIAVAKLGQFQVCTAQGDIATAKQLAVDLTRLCTRPSVLNSLGLSIVAALQMMSELSPALTVCRKIKKAVRGSENADLLSQAIYMEGVCLMGLGKWKEASKAWSTGVLVDRDSGNLGKEIDKVLGIIQANAMCEFSANGGISEIGIQRIRRMMADLRKRIDSSSAANKERLAARTHQIEGQLLVVAKKHMDALKSMSVARSHFIKSGLNRDVAFIDSQSGLILLDLGQHLNPKLLEESIDSFRRALEYFTSQKLSPIRWKIHYFLAAACLLIAERDTRELGRLQWLDAARAWIRFARNDFDTLKKDGRLGITTEEDLSSNLDEKSLIDLEKRLDTRPRERRRKEVVKEEKLRRSSRLMH